MTDLRNSLTHAIHDELDAALSRIAHCVSQLTDDQVWSRERADMNSIGNLVLHLTGNVGQMIVSGIGGVADTRQRQAEFDARGPVPKADLLAGLSAVEGRAKLAFADASDAVLCSPIAVGKYDYTGMQAVIRCVAHFRGHTQEIIHMTRSILGDAYQFAGPR
ncbi:MAG TPA: DUF1572 family protein [Gemmataceae bacterium]|nr:DUF1572 family protein [Gemmataceae bacterium]